MGLLEQVECQVRIAQHGGELAMGGWRGRVEMGQGAGAGLAGVAWATRAGLAAETPGPPTTVRSGCPLG
ncbi:MAG: hypothetical protein B7Z15_18280 [Rhizobiales bacterium 32-66-8]|nr:MAG: hypothetical protein B7Z15_18280 [Rhizobiales bacterium 32-66-8]